MSRQLNPSQVWSQVPVANRLIEVNTKTGFSLTAGSYVVRASSIQRGLITGSTSTLTATISSVTTTRAAENRNGVRTDGNNVSETMTNVQLTDATTITVTKNADAGITSRTPYVVTELF